MCVLLTIACMVLANWLMVMPFYCLAENNRGVDEAAMLWTVPLLTLVGYMNISDDVPTDHDIWSDLLNSSEAMSEDMYDSMSHKITQDEIFSNLGDLDEEVEGENGRQRKVTCLRWT